MALTRWYNLQIFLPSVLPPCLPSVTLPPLPLFLSLSRSPRAIHQRKSTGVLAFPFFGCSNELAVSCNVSLLSPSPRPFSFSCRGLLTFSSQSANDREFIADSRASVFNARPSFDVSRTAAGTFGVCISDSILQLRVNLSFLLLVVFQFAIVMQPNPTVPR